MNFRIETLKKEYKKCTAKIAYFQTKINQSLQYYSQKWIGKKNIAAFKKEYKELQKEISQTFYRFIKIDKSGRYYPTIRRFWVIFYRSFIFFSLYFFCIQTNFLWLTGAMPSVEELENPRLAKSSEIWSSDGVLLGKFFAENRTPVKEYSKISPNLVKALIATEDLRFYVHSGIDFQAMGGVFLSLLTGNGERGGGSTITQQLAKNLFKTRKKSARGLLGYIPIVSKVVAKSKEWLTAIKLERLYTKEEIILWYFNTVDFGSNAYGIKVAARKYFNTSTDSLTIDQAAILVGMQKATTTYNPKLNPEKSLKRRNVVIGQLLKSKFITKKQADSLSKLPIDLKYALEAEEEEQESYFKTAVQNYLTDWAKENQEEIDLFRDGLKIITTLDSRMQTHAEEAMDEQMSRLQRNFDYHWGKKNPWTNEYGEEIPAFIDSVAKRTYTYKGLVKKYKNRKDSVLFYMNKPRKMKVFSWKGTVEKMMSPMDSIRYYKKILQAGLLAMDPHSGEIKVWVGGLDSDFFKYDHVKQGKRQPGSTFKTFVYCTAIDGTKNFSPCDIFRDEPFVKEWEENGQIRQWAPKNASGYFTYADFTLREALARSINSITVQVTEAVSPKQVIEYARKLGIKSRLSPYDAIGLGIDEVSLYELVNSYCPFVNTGFSVKPMLVTRIIDPNGKILHEFNPETRRVLSEESAFLMQYMLRGTIEEYGGTAQGLFSFDVFRNGNQIGGKTGTTSNYSDSWFVGITKDLVGGVWVGGDDRSIHFRDNQGEGGRTALPVFGSFLEKIYRDKSLGIKMGAFPTPGVTILKDYQGCYRPSQGNQQETESDSTNSSNSPKNTTAKDSIKPEIKLKQEAKDTLKKKK